ncbi:TadE/TadG family type IV pilus assembly protein [Massilia sp. GCM10023247]|uniref:TadE/TadG family type IV pilus assembly protein n=1 Tax=Massilia sp. GCM10023247 TaxID=3252643 RepID=UPI00360C2A0D
MKNFPFSTVQRLTKRQAGAAAIEFALLLPIFIPFLTLGFFTASIFWHYTMAQKAAQDAVRYLATVPVAEMMTPALAEGAGAVARQIVMREIADISPGSVVAKIDTFCNVSGNATIICGSGLATGTPPTAVRVTFSIAMFDPTGFIDTGWYGLQINADQTMRYVGN